MSQEVRTWVQNNVVGLVIWATTMIFGFGSLYFQVNQNTSDIKGYAPKVEKIAEHQLLITNLNSNISELSRVQAQSNERLINKLDTFIDKLDTTTQALMIDVSVLKEKHSKE